MVRVVALLVAVAACSTHSQAPAPAATHTVNVRATAADVVALFQRNGIPVVSSDGTVVTTGPVDILEVSGGTGTGRVTGRVEYFVRATVSASAVTLTPWSRAIREGKTTEQVVPPKCSGTTKCSRLHSRLAALTDSLALTPATPPRTP